jgi:hypothetical protein
MEKIAYPVYRGPIIVGLIVICCFAWWWWRCPCCRTTCDYPTIREMISDPDCVAKPEELNVLRGDEVIWTNLFSDTLTYTFVSNSPFSVSSFWIPPGHQLVLKVMDDAAISTYTYERTYVRDGVDMSCDGGTTGPKVNVGGGGG